MQKKITTGCMFMGAFFAGFIPLLWGAGYFSAASIIFSAIGAIVGIYVGFKISR